MRKTQKGNYNNAAVPPPTTYNVEQYVASTISFTAAAGSVPAKINDSQNKFADKHFQTGQPINIASGSGTNDGNYTIGSQGVSRGTLTLSTDDSLTTENAATAGEVTINDRTYKPNVTKGCGFCGSLNSQ